MLPALTEYGQIEYGGLPVILARRRAILRVWTSVSASNRCRPTCWASGTPGKATIRRRRRPAAVVETGS